MKEHGVLFRDWVNGWIGVAGFGWDTRQILSDQPSLVNPWCAGALWRGSGLEDGAQ